MQMTQKDERTYEVVLSDAELGDLTAEAKERDFTAKDIMKAVFFTVFVQIVSCRWRRLMLPAHDNVEEMEQASPQDKDKENGG